MKSRHSIEIKALLDQKKITKGSYNPQSSINISNISSNQIKPLKRSDSSSTLRRKDVDISHIQQRYKNLEFNYQLLLQETKKRAELFQKERQQIERYKQAAQRDKQEIQRLTKMVNLAHAKEKSTLTELSEPTVESFYSRATHCSSNSRKKQIRTPSVNKSCLINKDSWSQKVATPLKKVQNSRICLESSQLKSQFSKYKFVPSLPL